MNQLQARTPATLDSQVLAEVLPSLCEALQIVDEAGPSPDRTHGALIVLRSALAQAIGIDESFLLDGVNRRSIVGIHLDALMAPADRLAIAKALLDTQNNRLRVGACYLLIDRFANLIWGVGEAGAQCVAAVGTTLQSCERAVEWALETSWQTKEQDLLDRA